MNGIEFWGYFVPLTDLIIFIFTLVSGIYALFFSLRMKKDESKLSSKLVLPVNCELKNCIDKALFCRFMTSKLMLLGIVLIAFSPIYLVTIIAIQYGAIPPEGYWLIMIPVFAVLVSYALAQRKAEKLFW